MGLDAEVLQARLSEAGRAGQPDVVREIAKNEFDLQVQKKLKSLCGGGVPSSLPWVVRFLSFLYRRSLPQARSMADLFGAFSHFLPAAGKLRQHTLGVKLCAPSGFPHERSACQL